MNTPTEHSDYDPRLAAELSAILLDRPLGRRLVPRPRAPRAAPMLALALGTAFAASGVGLAFEVNAVAESTGAGCLDALSKINVFARNVAESVREQTAEEQRAAKDRVADYANGLIATSCQGVDIHLLKETQNGVKPLASPSPSAGPGAVPAGSPGSKPVGPVCLEAQAKIDAYVKTVAQSVQGQSVEQQRAAKDRLIEYANGVIASTCPPPSPSPSARP